MREHSESEAYENIAAIAAYKGIVHHVICRDFLHKTS